MNVFDMLRRDEGKSNAAYPDPLLGWAKPTIGYGHTGPEVVQGLVWDDDLCEDALQLDEAHAEQGCEDSFPWFDTLNEARQAVLICMAFQLGVKGLLGFTTFLSLVSQHRFFDAANDLKGTLWYRQVPERAERLRTQMAVGEFQP
jgi:lysozyme